MFERQKVQQTKVFSEAQREEEKSLGVLTSLETLYYFIFIYIYLYYYQLRSNI